MLNKRFYKQVTVQEQQDGTCAILLDSRELKTPARSALHVPPAAARMVADEWDAQGDEVNPASMPATRLLNTAIDRVPAARVEIIDELMRHLDHDVLCHVAPHPQDLAQMQAQEWQPVLDWAEQEFGSRWQVTTSLTPPSQPDACRHAVEAAFSDMDDLQLACASEAAPILSSLVLTLAMFRGHLTPDQAFDTAELEARFQIQKWGEDEEAEARLAIRRAELTLCHDLAKACASS
ncbi:MAG: ATP12 family chaperone protein [Alphaproteobacteria bacterium]